MFANSFARTFKNQWKSFVLMFFCQKNSKHPQNTTRANDDVIPGQDQGSHLNDGTMSTIALS